MRYFLLSLLFSSAMTAAKGVFKSNVYRLGDNKSSRIRFCWLRGSSRLQAELLIWSKSVFSIKKRWNLQNSQVKSRLSSSHVWHVSKLSYAWDGDWLRIFRQRSHRLFTTRESITSRTSLPFACHPVMLFVTLTTLTKSKDYGTPRAS